MPDLKSILYQFTTKNQPIHWFIFPLALLRQVVIAEAMPKPHGLPREKSNCAYFGLLPIENWYKRLFHIFGKNDNRMLCIFWG